jgi:hypothetical protein
VPGWLLLSISTSSAEVEEDATGGAADLGGRGLGALGPPGPAEGRAPPVASPPPLTSLTVVMGAWRSSVKRPGGLVKKTQ